MTSLAQYLPSEISENPNKQAILVKINNEAWKMHDKNVGFTPIPNMALQNGLNKKWTMKTIIYRLSMINKKQTSVIVNKYKWTFCKQRHMAPTQTWLV